MPWLHLAFDLLDYFLSDVRTRLRSAVYKSNVHNPNLYSLYAHRPSDLCLHACFFQSVPFCCSSKKSIVQLETIPSIRSGWTMADRCAPSVTHVRQKLTGTRLHWSVLVEECERVLAAVQFVHNLSFLLELCYSILDIFVVLDLDCNDSDTGLLHDPCIDLHLCSILFASRSQCSIYSSQKCGW